MRVGALPVAALLLLAFTGPAAAQGSTELRGIVAEVHEGRARVVLEGDLIPAEGDTAALEQQVPGLGRVRVQGAWRVSSADDSGVWLVALPGAVAASPGDGARIFGSRVRPAPASSPDGAGGTLLLGEDFLGSSPFPSTPAPCRAFQQGEAFHLSHEGEVGRSCSYVFWQVGTLEGTVRISARMRAVRGSEGESFGLVFGYGNQSEGAPREGYHAFLISPGGDFKLTRLAGEQWVDLTDWRQTDALRRELGAVNELSVEQHPGAVELLANGRSLGRFDAPELQAGAPGLYVNAAGMEIALEDVRLVQLAPPLPRPPALPRRVLTQLDFESPGPGFDSDDPPCRTAIQDGRYLVSNTSPSSLSCTWVLYQTAARAEGPTRVSAKLRLTAGLADQPMGLVFGKASRESPEYFVFQIDGLGRYQVVRWETGGWRSLTPWVRRAEILPGLGAENRLAVELEGWTAHLFANGRFLRSVPLPAPPDGFLGIYVDEPGNSIDLDDLTVAALGGAGEERPAPSSGVYTVLPRPSPTPPRPTPASGPPADPPPPHTPRRGAPVRR